MPEKHEKDKFSITVCGEFFPEIYPAHRSSKWSRGEEDPLTTEMRLFCACMRWAFNRLLEGASRHEIKKSGQELFGLNSRYADDARLKAQALLVVDIAFFSGKPIVLENLNFGKDRLDTNKKFNRMASNFPFAKMVGAMYRRAVKEGVPFKLVSPRHTSTLGYWKYMKRYAVPVHCTAALVTGRRAIGFRERVTEELRQLVSQIKQNLTRKDNPDRPGEGKGMTRGVRACLRRLEERLSVHNGLAQSEQEAYNSVWPDLKLLALSVR